VRDVLFAGLALVLLGIMVSAVVVFYLWQRMPALRDFWERRRG
jgi:hypothetical protein